MTKGHQTPWELSVPKPGCCLYRGMSGLPHRDLSDCGFSSAAGASPVPGNRRPEKRLSPRREPQLKSRADFSLTPLFAQRRAIWAKQHQKSVLVPVRASGAKPVKPQVTMTLSAVGHHEMELPRKAKVTKLKFRSVELYI